MKQLSNAKGCVLLNRLKQTKPLFFTTKKNESHFSEINQIILASGTINKLKCDIIEM